LQFNGAFDSFVTVASAPVLQLADGFTLSAWVNPAAAQPSEPMVIGKEVPGGLPYVLYAQGAGVGPNAFTLIDGSYQNAAAPDVIPSGTWTHIAATYDGTALSVYVNGVLESSAAVEGSLTLGDGPLRIGNNAVFPNEGFAGRIDEVRVYSRALSTVEIQADMETPVSAATSRTLRSQR